MLAWCRCLKRLDFANCSEHCSTAIHYWTPILIQHLLLSQFALQSSKAKALAHGRSLISSWLDQKSAAQRRTVQGNDETHVVILCCQSNGLGSLGYHKHPIASLMTIIHSFSFPCVRLQYSIHLNSILYTGSSQVSIAMRMNWLLSRLTLWESLWNDDDSFQLSISQIVRFYHYVMSYNN